MKRFLLFLGLFYNSYAVFYDSYRGTPSTKGELQHYETANITEFCTNNIRPCDPNEARRVDGSCNNLEHPSRGTVHTPARRLLPEWFGEDYEPSKAASGKDLPLARRLRTELLPEGSVPSQDFTQVATYFMLFMVEETLSNHDIIRYVFGKPYSCCSAEGEADYECVNNNIPDDDPVHRFSEHRCINMTRPMTLQSAGCTGMGASPQRTSFETPLWDLSIVYGVSEEISKKYRAFSGGLLKYELVNGNSWPPSANPEVCQLNQGPEETRCHEGPDPSMVNSLVGINFMFIHFWRQHNVIAEELAKLNPCWDDQKLFDIAKDINIAIELQISYYEMMPHILGRKNLERDGIISSSCGFRDFYDEKITPQLSLEYPYALRYIHTMQEGTLVLYDLDGEYVSEVSMVDALLRTGFFAKGDNMAYITQGSFRQGSGAIDYVIDPIIGEMGLGPVQDMLDVTTNDLSKSRYFGFQPYIKYREFCFGDSISSWDDLEGIIDNEKIERLQKNYEDVVDIDLLAGMWVEKPISGGRAPPTFYCLVIDQMRINMISDRHWYESSKRPNAFTLDQLLEIRKETIASMLCRVGDSVTKIQKHAFARIGPNNELTDCSNIDKIDFSKWKDPACDL